MKTACRACLAAAALLLAFAAVGGAKELETFTTGKDWTEKMSSGEKLISLVAPTMLFQRTHVPLRLKLPEYIPILDKVILFNPQLEKEDVANIFASTVYKFEPESRPYLEWMETAFLRGHLSGDPRFTPRLTIQDYLKEAQPEPETD